MQHVRLALRLLRASAARWRTPKRCCSSTTATASERKCTSGSIRACVPTTSDSSPLASLPRMSPRRRAGVEPGEQRDGDRLGADQPLERGEMLLGERLGGRHQRGLMAVLDRAQHRVQRHHRLAAADLAHQQPLHRSRLSQICVDRRDRPALVARERERQPVLEPARAQRRLLGQRGRALVRAAAGTAAQEHELGQQQLLEGQPSAPRLGVGCVAREVHRRQRARPVGQPLRHARRRGQRLGHVCKRVPRGLHEGEDLRRADPLPRRIVRDAPASPAERSAAVPRRVRSAESGADRVMGHAKAPPLRRPCRAAAACVPGG